MKKLAFVAITGLSIAAVSLAGAAAIGASKFHGKDIDLSFFDDTPRCATVSGTADSRSLKWDGDDEVAIDVPAHVHYRPGSGDMVQLKGDPQLVAHVKIEDGKISLDCHGVHGWRNDRVDVTLPGRPFRAFSIAGLADLDLQQLDQPKLEISVAGSSDVTATGKADDVEISIAGRGDVHTKDLAVKKLELNIAGRGDVETAPQDDADISIAGSGDVKLYSEPKHISTSIMGSGNVEHLADKS